MSKISKVNIFVVIFHVSKFGVYPLASRRFHTLYSSGNVTGYCMLHCQYKIIDFSCTIVELTSVVTFYHHHIIEADASFVSLKSSIRTSRRLCIYLLLQVTHQVV